MIFREEESAMKRMLIHGAGSAGTMMANHLAKKLDRKQWAITVGEFYELSAGARIIFT